MLQEARALAKAMCSPDIEPYWLTISGKSGVGKTMLCRSVLYIYSEYLSLLEDENLTSPGVIIRRRGGMKHWPSAINDMLNGDYSGIPQLKEDWFVCIDDFAAEYERNRELSVSKLYEVLNCRRGKWTLLTCNLDLPSIAEKLDTRIASRLLRDDGVHINVNTTDYNLRKK